MTSQQLIEARAALWHHNAEPILTLEEAASWVATTGFLLFLPRRQQLRAPSPTFVEATMGTLEHTPARPEIENALSLAHRLFATGDALPLNLLGTLSEEPDFLIARDRLPWLLSLRGDRAWKAAPGGRTSPLNISVWKLLDEQGELTADEIRVGVGREVSDASIRRALIDLWGSLRVFPSYKDGGETTWTLTKTLCPKECAKGAATAQGAALSLFLADYLRSAIAVTEDEIASFLSPLASRSKLREILHALVTTRQLSTIPLGPNTLYYVEGELPEFPEVIAPVEEATAETATETGDSEAPSETAPARHIRKYTPRTESREPYQRRKRPQRDVRRSDSARPQRDSRPAARGDFRPRTEGSFKPRSEGGFKPRSEGGYKPRSEGNYKSRSEGGFKPRSGGGFKSRNEGSYKPRSEGGFKPRSEGGFKPRSEGGYKPRTEGSFKPRSEGGFKPRSEGSFKPRSEGSFKPRSEGSFKPRSEGGYKPRTEGGFKPRSEGSFKPRSEGGYKPRSEGGFKPRSEGGFKPRSEGSFKPRSEGGYKPRSEGGYKPRSEGGFKLRSEGGYKPRSEGGFKPRSEGGFSKSGPRTFSKGPKKSFGKGPGKSFGAGPKKPFGKGFSKGPKKSFGKGPGKPRRSE